MKTSPIVATAIILVGMVLFALPSVSIPLANDEYLLIERNMDHTLLQGFAPRSNGDYFYRPLVHNLFYRAMYAAFGLRARPYHLVDWLIFAANTLLVFLIARRLAGSSEAGAIVAGLYSISLVNTRIFMIVATITDLAMSFFALLSVYFFLRSRERSGAFARPARFLYPLFYLFAILSKEIVILLPAWFLVYDLVERRTAGKPFRRGLVISHAPTAVIFISYLIFRIVTFPGMVEAYQFNPIGFHLVSNFDFYCGQALAAPAATSPPGFVAFPVYGLLLAVLLAVWVYRNGRSSVESRLAILGVSWFLVGLALLIPLANRQHAYYISFAAVGLYVVFGSAAAGLLRRRLPGREMTVVAAYLFAVMALASWQNYRAVQKSWVPAWARLTEGIHEQLLRTGIDFPPGATIVILTENDFGDNTTILGVRVALKRPDITVLNGRRALRFHDRNGSLGFSLPPELSKAGVFVFTYTHADKLLIWYANGERMK